MSLEKFFELLNEWSLKYNGEPPKWEQSIEQNKRIVDSCIIDINGDSYKLLVSTSSYALGNKIYKIVEPVFLIKVKETNEWSMKLNNKSKSPISALSAIAKILSDKVSGTIEGTRIDFFIIEMRDEILKRSRIYEYGLKQTLPPYFTIYDKRINSRNGGEIILVYNKFIEQEELNIILRMIDKRSNSKDQGTQNG